MQHTNKSCNEPLYYLYSPLYIITTTLHTLPPTTDQSQFLLKPVITDLAMSHFTTCIHLSTSLSPLSTHFHQQETSPSFSNLSSQISTFCFLIQVLTVLISFLEKKAGSCMAPSVDCIAGVVRWRGPTAQLPPWQFEA